MTPNLKRDAPPEAIRQIQAIEDQADKWIDHLVLSSYSHDAAVWAALTQIVALTEEYIVGYGHGSQEQREAMINLARAGALLVETIGRVELPTKKAWLRWTDELRRASRDAVLAAHQYNSFILCYSMWHRHQMLAELVSPTCVRFYAPRSAIDRRVRAHQQGARIPGWPSTPDNPVDKSFVDSPDVQHLLFRLWERVSVEGALAMRYPDDSELLSFLRDIYIVRLKGAFRRNASFDLGGYDLEEFRRFFATLMSICSVHEYLCAAWQNAHKRYPFETAVLARLRSEWIEQLARLSAIEEGKAGTMITDLSLGTTKLPDLYTHPFVPARDDDTIFLVPHFILNSRPEENILRVCSYVRPEYYSVISNAKELEMRESIKASAPEWLQVMGPFRLPDPKLPDIDLVLKDTRNGELAVGELKWLRKSILAVELIDKDAEIEQGFSQVREVRCFLDAHPQYFRESGILTRSQELGRVHYGVIARDHIAYIPQQGDLWLTEFDALIWALRIGPTLADAVGKLRNLEWLPLEGRDFTARFETAISAGVTIETEVFHRPRPLSVASAV